MNNRTHVVLFCNLIADLDHEKGLSFNLGTYTKYPTKKYRETFTSQREKTCETSLIVTENKDDVVMKPF